MTRYNPSADIKSQIVLGNYFKMLKKSNSRTFGILITVLGTLVLTPDTLLFRLTATDGFTIAFWRGLFAGLTVFFCCLVVYGSKTLSVFRSLGYKGLLVAGFQGVGMVLFCVSLDHTSAANALILYSTAPVMGVVLSWIFLKEKASSSMLITLVVVCFGIFIVSLGSTATGTFFGDTIAFFNALCIAAFYVAVRGARRINMIPAIGLSFFISAALAYPLADFSPLLGTQWILLTLGGVLMLPVAISLLTIGPRYLPAPEVSMINLLEVCLAPLILWLVIGENPGLMSIAGGSIVVLALFAYATWQIKKRG